jgi:predicted ATPase/DNA-binding XRE family transcriptional regulator
MMTSQLSFGQWVKGRRKSLDLTQEELAMRVGCSLEMIQKIEAGKRRPSKQMSEQLAASLLIEPSKRAEFLRVARGEFVTAPIPTPEAQRPTNLHTPLTRLIGRDAEGAAVREYLLNERTRLLTLTGPPGIGKTRLSIEVAGSVLPYFNDGVFFVPLAPVIGPDLVTTTIAETLGVRECTGQPLFTKLLEFLQGKQLLLVLDNFEQMVAAGPAVAELLERSPGVKALITSREALRLHGEQQFRVPPLGRAGLKERPPVEELLSYPAIALFVERARAVESTFRLTEENAAAVNAICTQVDGLPLAIELVAARIRVLPPKVLLLKLADRLGLLTGGQQNLQSRHQSLRAAIDWSHDLLDGAEQTLFRRLGVFAGGCTLTSVEAICNATGDLPLSVMDGVASLLNKSLLSEQRLGTYEAAGEREPRFMMLETILEYAKDKLEGSGEAAMVRHLHFQYFLALAEMSTSALFGAHQGEWLARLDAEHENLRAALSWAIKGASREEGLRLTGALGPFWFVRGYITEGRRWLDAALAAAEGLPPGPALAEALAAAGQLAFMQGDHETAITMHNRRLPIHRQVADKRGLAETLSHLAMAMMLSDDYQQAEALVEESLSLYREMDDLYGIAVSLNSMGTQARSRREYARAIALFEESLALFEQIGNQYESIHPISSLGQVAYEQGDYARAKEFFWCALNTAYELGYTRGIAFTLSRVARTAAAQGELERAATLSGAADALYNATSITQSPLDHAQHEAMKRTIRGQLGDTVFQSASGAGSAMTIEQVVAYVREGEEEYSSC